MFKSFFIQNLSIELLKGIKRAKFSIQLVLEDGELLQIANELLETSKKDLQFELIVNSNTPTKSIKITNLLKRLVDAGIEAYWLISDYEKEHINSFGIIDKSFIIAKGEKIKLVTEEEVLNNYTNELNFLLKNSEQISLFEGEIHVEFDVDKPFIYCSEGITLIWKVSNAHSVNISPNIGKVMSQGEQMLFLRENTMFELVAKNNNAMVKRNVFVKVIKDSFITYTVEVFDPIINDYVKLKHQNNTLNKIGVYDGQDLKLSWECNSRGELFEKNLGLLPMQGFHECNCDEDLIFKFNFQSATKNETTSFNFIRFENIKQYDRPLPKNKIKTKNALSNFIKTIFKRGKKMKRNERKD
jgi:hypothetical protein